MQKSTRRFQMPTRADWNIIFTSFTKKEWYIFLVLTGLFVFSTLYTIFALSDRFEVTIPAYGGKLSEGIIGTPRYVNPIIALTDADRDLSTLIFSGLTREAENNTVVPDIAESYIVDDSGLTYTFVIRDDAVFHDGEPVRAEDVVYTIHAIQNDTLKSPLRVRWEGVSVEVVDEKTVVFTLKQPFAGFLENASVGIIPKHIWENVPDDEFAFSDFNIYAIGSGPYKVDSVSKKSSGVPESYTLRAFDDATLGKPYISTMTLHFYPNEEARISALKTGAIDQAGSVAPYDARLLEERGLHIQTTPLPRVFGLYFNQNKAQVLNQPGVKTAVEKAINRDKIIQEALYGYGTAISSPIPPGLIYNLELPEAPLQDIEGAILSLEKNGWTLKEDGFRYKTINKKETALRFAIATSDTLELKKTAELIRDDLSLIGILVDIKVYDTGTLNQLIIRERDYDALLFGKVVGQESDLFAFWHSSQRNDPGLNVSGYVNKTVDTILEKNTRESDPDVRLERYASFIKEITTDKPAVFLFSPSFIYVSEKPLLGTSPLSMGISSERFINVHEWYIAKERLWPLFTKEFRSH